MLETQGTPSGTITQRIVPLLQSLAHLEDTVAALALRLDPITNHTPSEDPQPPSSTVTGRLNQLGDTLQYFLDNIEL